MLFLIGEITLYIFAAALIGGGFGWWLRSLAARTGLQREASRWSSRLMSETKALERELVQERRKNNDLSQQLTVALDRLEEAGAGGVAVTSSRELEGRIAELESQLTAAEAQAAKATADHSREHDELERARADAARHADTVADLRHAEQDLRDEASRLRSALETSEEALAAVTSERDAANERARDATAASERAAADQTAASDAQTRELADELTAAREQLETAASQIATLQESRTEAETRAERSAESIRALETQLSEERSRAATADQQAEAASSAVTSELEARVQELEAALAAKTSAHEDAVRQTSAVEEQLTILQASTQDTQAAAAEPSDPDLADKLRQLESKLAISQAAIAKRDRRINVLERRVAGVAASAPRPTSLPGGLSEAPDQIDDLKRIKGVGPKLQRFLNRMGIYQYRQIAAWTPEQVDQIDQQLEGFQGRITRDAWVESASALHAEKYGD